MDSRLPTWVPTIQEMETAGQFLQYLCPQGMVSYVTFQYSTSSKCSFFTSNGILILPSISARGMFLTNIYTSLSGDKPVPVNLTLQDTECSRKALACQIVIFSLPCSPACSLLALAALSAIPSKCAMDMNFS